MFILSECQQKPSTKLSCQVFSVSHYSLGKVCINPCSDTQAGEFPACSGQQQDKSHTTSAAPRAGPSSWHGTYLTGNAAKHGQGWLCRSCRSHLRLRHNSISLFLLTIPCLPLAITKVIHWAAFSVHMPARLSCFIHDIQLYCGFLNVNSTSVILTLLFISSVPTSLIFLLFCPIQQWCKMPSLRIHCIYKHVVQFL